MRTIKQYMQNTIEYKEILCRKFRRIYLIIRVNLEYYFKIGSFKKAGLSKESFLLIKTNDSWHKEQLERVKNIGFRVIEKNSLADNKNSETLVILGSGPSINAITEKQWNFISSCDSFAFNWFMVHPFKPTYYHMELKPNNFELFKLCYKRKQNKLKNVPFMVNAKHLPGNTKLKDLDFINNVFVTVPMLYGTSDSKILNEVLRYHYFMNDIFINRLIHYRASLTLAISFGVLMGYKRIIMAGVDMYSNDYFFYDEAAYSDDLSEKVREYKKRTTTEEASKHRTADPGLFNSLPLDVFIPLYDNIVLKPKSIALFLLNENSLLYPQVDCYKL